jgi:hypothetical protein
MTSEADSYILPPTDHTSQFYTYFGSLTASNKNEQLPPPPAYTAVATLSTTNNAEYVRPLTNPATVFNDLVNQQSSPITQRQLNSQQILRINEYIDNQEKAVNDRLGAALCLSIFGIVLGSIGIGLFITDHNNLCGYYHTSSYCGRIYWGLILGCTSIFLGLLRLIVHYTIKARIIRLKKIWQKKIAQLQQTPV